MKAVEKYTDVVISERTFRINKFDARTGSFMLIKIAGLIAPLIKNVDLGKFKGAKAVEDVNPEAFNIAGIMSELGNLSEKDFNYVQEKCLQVCSEMLPAGPASLLNLNGTFGVMDLEQDTMTVIALTAHTLIFNVKGFFSGSPLASLVGGLLTTSRQD